jgi:hypothetical protein
MSTLVLLDIKLAIAFFWCFVQQVSSTNNWVKIMEHQIIGCPLLVDQK